MYMRVTRARLDSTKVDETVRQVGQDVAAAIRRLPGCQSYVGGADRATGRTINVSTWDTEEHARWSSRCPRRHTVQAPGSWCTDRPARIFEVTTT